MRRFLWPALAALVAAGLPVHADDPGAPVEALPMAPVGSPWSEEGVGGPLGDAARAAGGLLTSLAADGPTTWALHRVEVPAGEAEAPPVGAGSTPSLVAAPLQVVPAPPPEVAPADLGGPTVAGPSAPSAGPADPAVADALARKLLLIHAGAIALPSLPTAPPGSDAADALVARPADAGAEGAVGGAPASRLADALGTEARLARDEAWPTLAPPPAAAPSPVVRALAAAPLPAGALAPEEARPALLLALAGLLFLLPVLYHRVLHERALDHAGRRALYEAIKARPGCTIQGASVAAGIERGTAVYHLHMLVRSRLIRMERGTKEVHLFPASASLSPEEASRLAALARPRARQIAALVAARPGLTRLELAAAVGVAPSTLDWHLRTLLHHGLVQDRRTEERRRELVATPALAAVLAPATQATA